MDKKFIKNTLYYVFYRIINVIYPFVVSIYTARVLFAEGIGKVASAQNIVAYFSMLAALGLPNYGIKAIASKTNFYERSKTFWELFYINTVSTSICLVAYYMFICKSGLCEQDRILYIIVGLSIVLNYANVDWFYYGCEKFQYITMRSCAIKLFSVVLVVAFVREKSDYIIYALITCLAIAGNNIINLFNLRTMVKKIPIHELKIKQHIPLVMILLMTSISVELYTLLDTTMLTVICGSTVVGYYYSASKLVKVMITLLVSIGGALLPRLTYYYTQGEKESCLRLIIYVVKILFFLAVPCGIGLYILAPIAVPLLYGETFIDAILTVRILSTLFFSLTFSNLFGTQILLAVGQEKKLFIATFIGAVVNIIFNGIWIPLFQQNGAAIASVLSESVVTIVTYCFAKKYFNIHLNHIFILKCIISGSVMGGAMLLINNFSFSLGIQVGLEILVGVGVYLGSSIVLHNIDFVWKEK